MRSFLIPDVHGRYALVLGLLEKAGILVPEEEGFSRPLKDDSTVISLGDLANCVDDDRDGDLKCLTLVEQGMIDVYLVGNHEYPCLGGPAFAGFSDVPEIGRKIREFYREGKLMAAHETAGILITHAGLSRAWEGEFESAAQAAKEINGTWQALNSDALTGTASYELFAAIGRHRGGWDNYGGILWADWMEAKCRDFNQLVGHTPQKDQPPIERKYKKEGVKGNWAICADWGGKLGRQIAGCWINDDGTLEWVYYQRGQEANLGFAG